MPKIKFDEVKGLEPVPAGKYTATIVEAKEGLSSSGNPKIDVQWKIDGGPFDGKRVFDTMAFHEKALFRVKNTLQALGWSKSFDGDVSADDLIGKSAFIIVTIEVSTQQDENGEPYPDRNRVKNVKPLKAASPSQPAPPAKKGLLGR